MRPTSPKSLWFVSVVGVVAMGLMAVASSGCDKSEIPPNPIRPSPEIPLRDFCSGAGVPAESAEPCCLKQRDPQSATCAAPLGSCKESTEACTSSAECCSGVCKAGKCFKRLCIADNTACKTDEECCGGSCVANAAAQGGKLCAPLNTTCRTSGNPCGQGSECCSGVCHNNVCQTGASFCKQSGDVCGADSNCCSGTCTKAANGKLGTCAPPPAGATCKIEGQTVNANAADPAVPACGGECCSRTAGIGESGIVVCLSPSGCHPTGEACAEDNDCCSVATGGKCVKAAPTDKLGRCDVGGGACRAAGTICARGADTCTAETECCSGNTGKNPSACQPDLFGVQRCTLTGENCGLRPNRAGEACATSADCCGKPCVPGNGDAGTVVGDAGTTPFVCAASACIAAGGACTATADCCSGSLCEVTPGKTSGRCVAGRGGAALTCSLRGQSCKGVPCCSSDLVCNPTSERCEARPL